ncbi:MAG: phage major capsid protein, partial [Lachnospiraceae bacterium]|nr:phage major capsid protein [Lachnospiraceae bacterium]
QPDRLLGRPIYTSAFMPEAASDAKPIIFGDLSYYWIADRTARTFKRLDERCFYGFAVHVRAGLVVLGLSADDL